MNESHLPSARPVLDGCLALKRVSNIVEALRIDQSLQAVVFCKTIDKSLTMFVGSPWQVARDAKTPLRRLVMK
jgi:hypothetical protein